MQRSKAVQVCEQRIPGRDVGKNHTEIVSKYHILYEFFIIYNCTALSIYCDRDRDRDRVSLCTQLLSPLFKLLTGHRLWLLITFSYVITVTVTVTDHLF
jgi:hypothetical protein